ncbi:MAG: DUF349 domain-containing protein [Paramuribaculum sp.]|nr:DUF349 domain-containing protein [Paramuribaculum sp.]
MEFHEKVDRSAEQTVDATIPTEATGAQATVAESQLKVNEEEKAIEIESAELSDEVLTAEDADGTADNGVGEPRGISDILLRLKELQAGDASLITTDEIGRLKQQFYSFVNELMAVRRDEFVAAGNDPETFAPTPLEEEAEFKALMGVIKEKRNEYRARIEAEQLANLERKQAIISELSEMASDTDNVNRHYPRAKELQTAFKEIGDVPQQNTTQVWKAFQEAVEHFYDQWKVNKELRDYDFKKNLSEKQLLIDEAKNLMAEDDVLTAFRRLQELHEKWRETGPVAKDLREEIWAQFKDASAEINKRYQAFFEERKQREQASEAAKTALCEAIESIDTAALTNFTGWNDATRKIMDAQKEWKTIGFASRKANSQLFTRFRKSCDAFFSAKAEFFQSMKTSLAENLEAKTRLCEQAEALADSTEWRKTTDRILELQKEWKTIGAVPKKHSDAIWQRFLTACNSFFDRKKHATSDVRRAEQANLKTKKAIIAELNALNSDDATMERAEALARIKELRSQWQETGHVPFKDKDRLHEAYREVMRQVFDKYDIHEKRARMESFQNSLAANAGDKGKLSRERDRMMRAYESRKAELATYENNLSFLSARSRSGSSMLAEIEKNIQRLKNSIADMETRIRLIDEQIAGE